MRLRGDRVDGSGYFEQTIVDADAAVALRQRFINAGLASLDGWRWLLVDDSGDVVELT